jgi:hypothetical protein
MEPMDIEALLASDSEDGDVDLDSVDLELLLRDDDDSDDGSGGEDFECVCHPVPKIQLTVSGLFEQRYCLG